MNKFNIIIALALISEAYGFNMINQLRLNKMTPLAMSDSVDAFGGGPTPSTTTEETPVVVKEPVVSTRTQKMEDQAAKLRREAAEMELALREEARAKGLPQEMIDKLVPMRGQIKKKVVNADGTVTDGSSVVEEEKPVVQTLTSSDVRKKLGYLNTGDPVRFTSELDRLKSKQVILKWNSNDLSQVKNFDVNNYQMKSKTSIEPVDLRLDDVGFEYQKVFIIALGLATVLGLGSTVVGGQLGFILGYASALFPVTLVGIGSIAPALIGDILLRIKFIFDEESRERNIRKNAAKFLVGYTVGLPVATYKTASPSNEAEFFQLRPTGKSEAEDRKMFSQTNRKQSDIARASAMSVAGSVAECMKFKEASGTSAGDVNTLYELMNAVEPTLAPEKVQNHIRWSVVESYKILDENKEKYELLVDAFREQQGLEECIAIIEGV